MLNREVEPKRELDKNLWLPNARKSSLIPKKFLSERGNEL
jgi:hypothetical protein